MSKARAPDAPQMPPKAQIFTEQTAAAHELSDAIKQLHRRISNRVMQDMQAELTELDLSFSQMTALHHLRARGVTSVTQLAEGIHLSLPASSHLVERLVQRGLVQRGENPENRREKVVSLTPAGQDVLQRMDAAFTEAYVRTLDGLPLQTLQTASAHLANLNDALDDLTAATSQENP